MTFLSLMSVLAITTLIASLITNFLKGIIMVISGLGICFYLFFATTTQKATLDSYAKNIDMAQITSLSYVKELEEYIKTKVMGMAQDTINQASTAVSTATN